ncbi:MAG: hypothetical protein JNM14_16400 [Ferruginibacter sp.]|nr:hypothetical protein [Ferruginibacter sp.]
MTEEQFTTLMDKLSEINDGIKLLTAKDSGKELYNLADIFHKLDSVVSAVESVEGAVNKS